MKITVIGSGYVGLVTGTCFAEFGYDVTCVDKDPAKIQMLTQGQIPIFEPGLDLLVASNQAQGRLRFTQDLTDAVRAAQVVFIAVGTPTDPTSGRADLQYVYAAAKEIAAAITDYTVVVTKSTVPFGTGRQLMKILKEVNPNAPVDVVSNPEFLREGSAIEDFMRPDRVVVGTESDRAAQLMRQLYRPLSVQETPIVFTGLETAELIKYASNAFLATKIAFINEMADLCEQCGADVQAVSKGMGLDHRIGSAFLQAGPGYGGSCFPKDTLALVHTAQDLDSRVSIVEAVVDANEKRKKTMFHKVKQAMKGSLQGKKIALLGVTFKPNTDDMRESPSLELVPQLLAAGAQVHVFDPQGRKEGQALLPGVTWSQALYDTFQEADALVLLTEWNEFRALKWDDIRARMRAPLVVDLRNVYPPQEVAQAGFDYISVGRPVARAVSSDLKAEAC